MTKHVHYDLIVEWAKDPDQPWQYRVIGCDHWFEQPAGVEPRWHEDHEYRKTPRRFKEGWWYPITYDDGQKWVLQFNGEVFGSYISQDSPCVERIGEGYLPDFGDNNER